MRKLTELCPASSQLSLHRSILTDVPPTTRYPRRNVNISGISLNDCGREFGIFQVRAEFSQVRVSDVTFLLGIPGLQCSVDRQTNNWTQV